MISNYHFSDSNEKMVTETKNFLLAHSLKKGRHVILDETNINRRNFEDVCETVKKLNIDCVVMEKSFYVELAEAIARDAQRTGTSKVGEEVVSKFWKKSGGVQHKFYKPRVQIFNKRHDLTIDAIKPDYNSKLPWTVVCDLDGTLALFNTINKDGTTTILHENTHARNPYDASSANNDSVNEAVASTLEALSQAGYKIVFCSGREDIYRDKTEMFLKKHISFDYKLLMRNTGDHRKDFIIKDEIYQKYIKPYYNVLLVLDDRTQVVDYWRSQGLTCFQVAPGDF
jgi:predicted kinase